MKDYIKKIKVKEKLTFEEINDLVEKIANNEVSDAQIGAFLTGITLKGVDKDEFYGFAYAMRKFARRVITNKFVVDSCGTGADFSGTINISTSAAIVANACGAKVVKQTNSSITSSCGSSDFLHALGINIVQNPDQALEEFNKNGITFVHSPYFNDFARVNNPIRQQLGIKTIFNYLGPLINPSFPEAQLLGVSSAEMCYKMAYALNKLGTKHAIVVNGTNPNIDEISLCSESKIFEVKDGNIDEYTVTPEKFGLKRVEIKALQGGSGLDNARIVTEIFKGERLDPRYDIICLNAGAMLYLYGISPDIISGVKLAKQAISDGVVLKILTQLQKKKHSVKIPASNCKLIS